MKDLKAINLIVEKLKSKNTEEVLITINKIRNSGDPKILFYLINLLNTTSEKEISTAIARLLNDLKLQSGTNEIIDAIKNDDFRGIRKILLTSCWQSGLNYSEHLPFFVDLFVLNEFDIAFEAFTIIESIEETYPQKMIYPLIEKVKSGLSSQTETKKDLLEELIHILESKIE